MITRHAKARSIVPLLLALAGTAAAADAPPPAPSTPFNGRTLEGWAVQPPPRPGRGASHWAVAAATLDPQDPTRLLVAPAEGAAAQLVNTDRQGLNLHTTATYGDCTIELEFMVPQGSNSGVYVMGEYELQIKDSFGKAQLTYQDLGAIYKVAAPRCNAARQPGQWQQLRIDFRAPRFEAGRKTANARFVAVVLNGQTIHQDVELPGATPGGLIGKESPRGPLMLQGDHGPVAYRNLRITSPSNQAARRPAENPPCPAG